MEDMKITFSDIPHDYSGWMAEKSTNVLGELTVMLRENPALKDSDSFTHALSDSLKIFALCHGNLNGIHCKLVRTLLYNYCYDGFCFLLDLLNRTKNSKIMQDVLCCEREERILALIEQDNRSNRSLIAEALARMERKNKWAEVIARDIEFVHNGEKTWTWFYKQHCNDRDTFAPFFKDVFIKEVYDYFQSDEYINADNSAGIIAE